VDLRERVRSLAVLLAANALAVVAFAVLALTGHRTLGYILTTLAMTGLVWHALTHSFRETIAAQLLLAAGVLTDYHAHLPGGQTAVLATAGAVLALLIAGEPVITFVIDRPRIRVGHLPGYASPRTALIDPRVLRTADVVAVAVAGVSALAGWSPWVLALFVAVVAVATGAVGLRETRERLRGTTDDRALRTALEAYDPKFALHFTAPENTEFHVTMWLPYLDQVGEPYVIVLREPYAFEPISAATRAPVLYCPNASFLDRVVTPGMKACFYPNNGALNTHMVRLHHLTHIHIGHGDSDKAAAFNPVTAMFDRIFVPGRAAIDRYAANSVRVPEEKFHIVGRPQAAGIEVARHEIADVPDKTVLYALTWVGLHDDLPYCSLPVAEKIVAVLLERKVRVILRPHPYSARHPPSARRIARVCQMLEDDRQQTGREHVFGEAAARMSLVECMNAADAMISDVSAVAQDWLYSGKPLALTDMLGQPRAEFEAAFPLARAAYLVDPDTAAADGVLDDLLEADPMAAARRATRAYYLGDFPPEGYADRFVDAVRSYLR
jgi:hypothetical protein